MANFVPGAYRLFQGPPATNYLPGQGFPDGAVDDGDNYARLIYKPNPGRLNVVHATYQSALWPAHRVYLTRHTLEAGQVSGQGQTTVLASVSTPANRQAWAGATSWGFWVAIGFIGSNALWFYAFDHEGQGGFVAQYLSVGTGVVFDMGDGIVKINNSAITTRRVFQINPHPAAPTELGSYLLADVAPNGFVRVPRRQVIVDPSCRIMHWLDYPGIPTDGILHIGALDLDTCQPRSQVVTVPIGAADWGQDNTVIAASAGRVYAIYQRPVEYWANDAGFDQIDFAIQDLHAVCARPITIGASGVSWAGDEGIMGYSYGNPLDLMAAGGLAVWNGGWDAGTESAGWFGPAGIGAADPGDGLNITLDDGVWALSDGCVVPPLRMKQRDDGLGKVDGSGPRLGRSGTTAAASRQGTDSRLRTDEGQTYL